MKQVDVRHTQEAHFGNRIESLEAMMLLLKETGLNEDQGAYVDAIYHSILELKNEWKELQSLPRPTEIIPADRFNILVVEDDAVQEIFAVRTLEKAGYHVTVAKDGHEALKRIINNKFDLILMDCQMHNLDGFETTKYIRVHEKKVGGHIPIVAYTVHSIAGYKQRCLQVGMDDYLQKPVSSSDLVACAERYRQHKIVHRT